MPNLSTLQDLEKQLEVVRLHQWLQGPPEGFQQACLILRTDAKVEVDPQTWFEECDDLRGSEHAWVEGSKTTGFRFFIVDDEHELGEVAKKYIAQAREELGYLTPAEEDGTEGTYGCGNPDCCPQYQGLIAGKAVVSENETWNDSYASKKQVIEVLELAIQKAKARSKSKVSA